jgi:hypothetical protein
MAETQQWMRNLAEWFPWLPDGADIHLTYNATTGRIEQVSTPGGAADFDYDAAGRLWTLDSPDGVTLTYGYDGPIPTQETWSGTVSGEVSVTLDQDFRVWKQRVNGTSEITYGYDRDGLVTQAGALTDRRAGLGHGQPLDPESRLTGPSSAVHVRPYRLAVAGEPCQAPMKRQRTTMPSIGAWFALPLGITVRRIAPRCTG